VLKESDQISTPIITIPILNVDGYRVSTKLNSHGVDLDKNLPVQDWEETVHAGHKSKSGPSPLSEPESQFLFKVMEKFPPHFLFSFQGPKPLISYNSPRAKVIADYLAQFNNYPLSNAEENEKEIMRPCILQKSISEKFKCPSLILHCPKINNELSLKDIWEKNQTGLINLMQSNLIPIGF
jgi:protein MpaA